jgi:Zn-dependent peptidase ImmA (M78 family)
MKEYLLILFFGVNIYMLAKRQYENFLENDTTITRLKVKLYPVFPELKRVKIMKGTSSYTIDKQKIYLCTESEGTVYEDNMLIFVLLHELGHALCPEIGHGELFQTIFKDLLNRAEKYKLWDSSKPAVKNYCKQ